MSINLVDLIDYSHCGMKVVTIRLRGNLMWIPNSSPVRKHDLYQDYGLSTALYDAVGQKLASMTEQELEAQRQLWQDKAEENIFFDPRKTFTKDEWQELLCCLKNNPGCLVSVHKEVYTYWRDVLPPEFRNCRIQIGEKFYNCSYITGEGCPLYVGIYDKGHKMLGLTDDAFIYPEGEDTPIHPSQISTYKYGTSVA